MRGKRKNAYFIDQCPDKENYAQYDIHSRPSQRHYAIFPFSQMRQRKREFFMIRGDVNRARSREDKSEERCQNCQGQSKRPHPVFCKCIVTLRHKLVSYQLMGKKSHADNEKGFKELIEVAESEGEGYRRNSNIPYLCPAKVH